MKQAASHLANRKLQRATEKEKFLTSERGWDEEVINEKRIIPGKVTFLGGTK